VLVTAPYVGLWHEADLRLAAPQGLLTAALPTLRPECRFTSTVRTLGAEGLFSGRNPTVF
jgi:hypothetical protein